MKRRVAIPAPRRTTDGGWMCEHGSATRQPCGERAVWILEGCKPEWPGAVSCTAHRTKRGIWVALDEREQA